MRTKLLLASGLFGVIAVVSLLLLWSDSAIRASNTTEELPSMASPTGPGKVAPEVIEALSRESSVSVIVSLGGAPAPSAVGPQIDIAALTENTAARASRVLASLVPGEFELRQQYQVLPALSGDATVAGVWALAAQPDVVHVGLNFEVRAELAQAVPLIGADDVHNLLGVTGEGVVVAVLDTGIDTDHPLLLDDVNHQMCFLSGGGCPGGDTTGPSAEDGHGHGSHVSGIITSAGPPAGVAPDALIDAFKVLDDSGTGTFANVIAAYDEIIVNHPEVDVINMSLGTGSSYYPGKCQTIIPAFTTAIATARAMGMTTFAASGNNASKFQIGYPACLNDVVSVGAVYDADVGDPGWGTCTDSTTAADQVVCFSQSNTSLDLLAPGSQIDSTVPGGGLANFSGTSMASPAAAAVAALLLESEPLLTPVDVETRLKETGVPVTDAGNGVTTCRVDAYEAVLNDGGFICPLVGPPPSPPPPPPPPPNDDFVDAYIAPDPREYADAQLTTGATTELSEPSPCGDIGSTVWYSFTPSSTETLTMNTFGSGFDTVLALYTGPSVGSLALVRCNDDFGGGLQSQVRFSVAAGTTYHIQVGGFNGAGGSLTLNLNTPVVPPCPVVPTFSFSIADPVGDNFGLPNPNHDIISVAGEGDDSLLCLTIEFAGPVDPYDSGSGQKVAGWMEFDTDQDPTTGVPPGLALLDLFCPDPAGMGMESLLEAWASGGFGRLDGTLVPITFGTTSFVVFIPLSLIGGDTAFDFNVLMGTTAGGLDWSDCAPYDGGCIRSQGYICGEPSPTPTDTPTPTFTPTDTPTDTPTPTITPTPTPTPPDTDGDGCNDVQESGPDETLGGRRDPLNPWDFYDVLGPGAALPTDGVIDLPNDILGVIQRFSPTGVPPYDVQFDRGVSSGPNPWNMTAPDGVIDLPNDILGVILQFNHSCQ